MDWDGIEEELNAFDNLEDFATYILQANMEPRTNNRLEGWHSRLKQIVKKPTYMYTNSCIGAIFLPGHPYISDTLQPLDM